MVDVDSWYQFERKLMDQDQSFRRAMQICTYCTPQYSMVHIVHGLFKALFLFHGLWRDNKETENWVIDSNGGSPRCWYTRRVEQVCLWRSHRNRTAYRDRGWLVYRRRSMVSHQKSCPGRLLADCRVQQDLLEDALFQHEWPWLCTD